MPSEARKVHNIGDMEISRERLPAPMQRIRLRYDADPVKAENPVPHTLGIGHPDRQSCLLDGKKHLDRFNYAAKVMTAESDHDSSRHFLLLLAICVPIVMSRSMHIQINMRRVATSLDFPRMVPAMFVARNLAVKPRQEFVRRVRVYV